MNADEAVMIGDTEYDLEMASNAKIRSIGVSYDVHKVESLHSRDSVVVVNGFTEINDIIRGM